jgi:FkbM family methyltransferase
MLEITPTGAEFTVPTMGVDTTPRFTPRIVEARHGTFTIYDEDELVGMSLATYGEYSEGEVVVFKKCLRPGMVAIDVGANIGAFTVPMAKIVGRAGKVYAFEASQANVPLLVDNATINCGAETEYGGNIVILPCAASDKVGTIKVSRQDALHAYCRPEINDGDFEIECITIDSLNLPKVDFIKIDVDRHEMQVLNGAAETIKRCRPIIYLENEDHDLSEALIARLVELGYRMYWHRPFHFNVNNYAGKKENIFGVLVSIMMLCVPDDDYDWNVQGLDEAADIRQDDDMFNRESARYARIVEKNPHDLMSRLLVAHYENLMQRTDNADRLIVENLLRDPEHKASLNIKALLDLQRGDYHRGWKGYELRYGHKNLHLFGGNRKHENADGEVPRWDGRPTDDTVLIWTEQGFGDQIMFARFIKHVLDRAPNTVLEVQPELFELFEYSRHRGDLPVELWPIVRCRRSLPRYAYHLPLPSVPAVLDLGAEDIKITRPYLSVDPMMVENWRGTGNHSFVAGRHPMNGARVGLCGVGSLTSERPYTRDVPAKLLAPLVRRHGPFFSLESSGQFESFATTAAAIMALDLVITVDTSVAHLAGALGKPVWLMLSWDPDWRWGLKGETTIWYPQMRIFRQPKFRDWQSVIDNISGELDKGI